MELKGVCSDPPCGSQIPASRRRTDPSCLYYNAESLHALKNCELWFLFTDGQISSQEVEKFGRNTAHFGLHGVPNVVVIFGNAASRGPGLVDISVGIITYSAAPDSLLLFHDVSTGTLYLRQAKGCFKTLLPAGSEQPELTSNLAWYQVPRILYQDLARLDIPKPKKLNADELALADGLVIRLKDLYTGQASPEVIERVSQKENLRSLTMHQTSAGRGQEFQTWLQQQQIIPPSAPRERPDIDGKAQEAITTLLNAIKNGTSEMFLETYRSNLRAAHKENWEHFRKSVNKHKEVAREVYESNQRFHNAASTSHEISSSKASSGGYVSNFSPAISMGFDVIDYEPSPAYSNTSSSRSYIPNSPSLPEIEECFLPGFVRGPDDSRKSSEFVGQCMLCRQNSVLALLLQRPTESGAGKLATLELPLLSKLFFSSICCNACASYLVPPANLLEQSVVSALALVSVANNKDAWLKVCSTVWDESSAGDRLLACLAASFEVEINQKVISELEEDSLYRKALGWVKQDLKKLVAAPSS